MTNKLKYFIGNWKMFGDFGSIKIIYQIHRFCLKFSNRHKKNKIVICVPNTLIFFVKKEINVFGTHKTILFFLWYLLNLIQNRCIW